MKQVMKTLISAAAALSLVAGASFTASAQEAQTLQELLEQVQTKPSGKISKLIRRASALSVKIAQTNRRCCVKLSSNSQTKKLVATRLQEEYAQNEIDIGNKETELDNMIGTLGRDFRCYSWLSDRYNRPYLYVYR